MNFQTAVGHAQNTSDNIQNTQATKGEKSGGGGVAAGTKTGCYFEANMYG